MPRLTCSSWSAVIASVAMALVVLGGCGGEGDKSEPKSSSAPSKAGSGNHPRGGSSGAIGGGARRFFSVSTYFPPPDDFVPGGVRIGSRVGECEVPRPSERDRAGLRAAAERGSRGSRVALPGDPQLLLADCGRAGRFSFLFWRARPRGKKLLLGDEFHLRRGRWIGSAKGSPPGCGIPRAAAAVWKIDVSVCDSPRRRRAR